MLEDYGETGVEGWDLKVGKNPEENLEMTMKRIFGVRWTGKGTEISNIIQEN